jgi:RNA polymerase sigma-70 factor (ECF subfamily)
MMASTLQAPLAARGPLAAAPLPPFEAVFETYGAEVYRYLRRLAADAGEAADLHQEAFLRAFAAYGRLGPGANVRAWLYRIAANLAVDAHRRRARAIQTAADPPDRPSGAGDPEASVRAGELRAAVRLALLELSPSQRLAVCARLFDGLAYPQVSDLLGCSETAARQHVSQGLRRLRAALADWQ